jgi:hypothetical protein
MESVMQPGSRWARSVKVLDIITQLSFIAPGTLGLLAAAGIYEKKFGEKMLPLTGKILAKLDTVLMKSADEDLLGQLEGVLLTEEVLEEDS